MAEKRKWAVLGSGDSALSPTGGWGAGERTQPAGSDILVNRYVYSPTVQPASFPRVLLHPHCAPPGAVGGPGGWVCTVSTTNGRSPWRWGYKDADFWM